MSESKVISEVDSLNFKATVESQKFPFEYQWPQDKSGEYFHLEMTISSFLNDTNLLQKYPDIDHHEASIEERKFLFGQGVITENLFNSLEKKIMALSTDDVRHVMIEYYPSSYRAYVAMLHEKEKQAAVSKTSKNGKTLSIRQTNALKKAMKDSSDYNALLLQQRREERASYYDMQTQLIHIPARRNKKLPPNMTIPSKYPVALLPGQYQEYYHSYSFRVLNQLPLNTVIAFPPPPQLEVTTVPEAFQMMQQKSEGPVPVVPYMTIGKREEVYDEPPPKRTYKHRNHGSGKKDPVCGICLSGPEKNKNGLAEELIHCSECENSGHPTCLDMSPQLVRIIKTYPWQCMECKRCTLCNDPHDEDKMLFCDECDRGYHSFCVGLTQIPIGRWICDKCGMCASCLKRVPGPEGSAARWKHEFTIPNEGEEPQFLQTLCISCSRLFRNGNFCPICLKVYRNDETDLPMVCCDHCDRWTHTDCEGIDEKTYRELSRSKSQYKCALCRGEKEERIKGFTKKYAQYKTI